jgi:hypothetical protein
MGGSRIQGGKFCGLRFTHNDGTRRFQACYRGRIVVGHIVGKDRRPHCSAHTSRIEDVLDSEWHPVERPTYLPAPQFLGTAMRRRKCPSPIEGHPSLHLRFNRLDPGKR